MSPLRVAVTCARTVGRDGSRWVSTDGRGDDENLGTNATRTLHRKYTIWPSSVCLACVNVLMERG